MSRAHELQPVPPRDAPEFVVPGNELTPALLAAVTIEEHHVGDVRVVVYRPTGATGRLPLIVSVHGGGFIMLSPETMAGSDAELCARHGAVVVAPDYRLAPEHPFPAGFDDCWTALLWAIELADVDPERVVVTGGSAGGALAAGLALRARDEGGPAIRFQALHIPVLDDRLDTPSMQQTHETLEGALTSAMAEGMWLHYLGEDTDRADISPYAAPARASSLAGLPPAYIDCFGRDPLRDEAIAYASRLLADGVDVELHVLPDLCHGLNPLDHPQMVLSTEAFHAAIARALFLGSGE